MQDILDPCCGSRMFWFDKKNPRVLFSDIRREEHTLCDGRKLSIAPDIIVDFTSLPFPEGQFKLVVFDPPHLTSPGPNGWQGKKYGKLPADWRDFLRKGFEECFRVLQDDGILIFKWNEHNVSIKDVLALTPYAPLFGHTTGLNGKTHWCTFMKPNVFERALLAIR